MKKILITGATGFVGKYLVDYIAKNSQDKVYGTYISDSPDKRDQIEFVKIDLNNEQDVQNMVGEIKPDYVYHLAALSSASDSFKHPKETIINNVSVQVNLLEAIKKHELKETKILIISSAEIYGMVDPKDLPINEKTELNPTNPYAVSKITQDFLALQYYLAFNLKTFRVRPFNHTGPGQRPDFVVSAFAKKIAEIEKGKREKVMTVGNLETKRDFTDVRDIVEGYAAVMEKGKIGEVYNMGSGKSHKISEILEIFISLSTEKIEVKEDPSLFRPFDDPDLVCDADKIKKDTGWEPQIPLNKTLKDTLDYWRNII